MAEFYITSNKYSLSERQTKRGRVYDLTFRVVDRITLEVKQKKLSGFATKTLAKEAYLKFVQEHCEFKKGITAKAKDPDKQLLFIEDLVREYLSTLGNQNKGSTVYSKHFIYRDFVVPFFRDTTIDKLDKQKLSWWKDELYKMKNPRTETYYSTKYLKTIWGHFSTFLSWVEERYGYKNNLREIKKPKSRAPKKKMQIWTKEQFEKFIAVVDDPMWHCFFTIAFYTGRRKGELFALSPADILGDKIVWDKSVTRKTTNGDTYEVTSTKAEKDQTVPICKQVQEELKRYRGKAPFFFGGSRPLGDNNVRRRFQEYCEKAGVPLIRIHDLRHSFVSMLIHLGANIFVVADLIGDKPEQITQTYGHLYHDDKIAIINKI